MNVLCLKCGGMQLGVERRGCGVTEEICCRCGTVCDVDFDDDDEIDPPEQEEPN
jgi:hypothetical protein